MRERPKDWLQKILDEASVSYTAWHKLQHMPLEWKREFIKDWKECEDERCAWANKR